MNANNLYEKLSKKIFNKIKKSQRTNETQFCNINDKQYFYIAIPINDVYDFSDGVLILKCDKYITKNKFRYVHYLERIYIELKDELLYENKRIYKDTNNFALSFSNPEEVLLNKKTDEKLCDFLFYLLKKY